MEMIPVDGDFILAIAPHYSGKHAENQARIIGAISAQLAPILDAYNINTRLRIAHFMGQVTHECAGFITTEEFASGAAYEGRKDLGNTQKGDGKRYKGRGLIQLTGRHNYRQIGSILNLPLEDEPHIAAEPLTSLRIACEYWASRNINQAADNDDLIDATQRVNGGQNGREDRGKYVQKAKVAIARIQGLYTAQNEGGNTIVLRRGSFGDDVAELQKKLVSKGYHIAIDGDFGSTTEFAVFLFQTSEKLIADGIVGQQTWQRLDS